MIVRFENMLFKVPVNFATIFTYFAETSTGKAGSILSLQSGINK